MRNVRHVVAFAVFLGAKWGLWAVVPRSEPAFYASIVAAGLVATVVGIALDRVLP